MHCFHMSKFSYVHDIEGLSKFGLSLITHNLKNYETSDALVRFHLSGSVMRDEKVGVITLVWI